MIVIQPDVEDPYNDCSQEHIDQGFSWRNRSISFYHPDAISCLIEILVGDEQSFIGGDPQRIILVPFASKNGSIEVGEMLAPQALILPEGPYQLTYELFPGSGMDSDSEPFD